jgi:hypothetical protein
MPTVGEPRITINGRLLTEGQAMTVRVALSAMSEEMNDQLALGDDEHGLRMTKGYKARLLEIFTIMEGN